MRSQVHASEGTSSLPPTSPDPDDVAFTERLAPDGVYVLPGALVEIPGRFRISLTGTDDMVERAIPVSAAARR
ncbi:MAG: aminotransferase class I/II-fold pyridoxal phosphate-dependent enzyme [Actinomycetota bacterium]